MLNVNLFARKNCIWNICIDEATEESNEIYSRNLAYSYKQSYSIYYWSSIKNLLLGSDNDDFSWWNKKKISNIDWIRIVFS